MELGIRKASSADTEQMQAIARRTIDADYRSFLDDEGVDLFVCGLLV